MAVLGIGENESSRVQERKHEAVAAVRLVNKDGDVIWSTTQESQGGKFRRASTDVADRITKKLVEDYERAKKLRPLSPEQLPAGDERLAVHVEVGIVIRERGGPYEEPFANPFDGALRLSEADPIRTTVTGAGRDFRVESIDIEVEVDFADAPG